MKIRILPLVVLLAVCEILHAQGWVANPSSNFLYSVNGSLLLSPLSIGIGTSSPTAQFHTTGTVRLSGLTTSNTLTKLLASDASGNIFLRDVSSLLSGGSWNLIGNSATSPGTNFVGTTDNQRLVFKTNSTEQATILPDGKIGIGTSTPTTRLHIYKNTPDETVAVSGVSPSVRLWGPTAANSITGPGGVIGLATTNSDYNKNSVIGDLVITNNRTNAIIFATDYNSNQTTGLDERMRINGVGNIGMGTISPTARLHVNGTVRLENLPSGGGNYLVVDALGNVRRSTQSATSRVAPSQTEIQSLQSELEKQKSENVIQAQQIVELKATMTSMMNKINSISLNSRIDQNEPNPVFHNSTIKYFIAKNVKNASCTVYNANGIVIKSIRLNERGFESTVNFNTLGLESGMYVYQLIADGKVIDTKKMIVSN
jgi:hypothetical protein